MAEADFDLTGKTADEIGQELEHNLWLKGYCVLDMKLESSIDDALDEMKDLRRDDRFTPCPPQLVEGLLGQEGSGEIAWLSQGEQSGIGQKLETLSQDLFYIADCSRPFFENQGMTGMGVSETLVIQGGEPVDDEEGGGELTESSCSRWISTFLSAKLMLIYFMGPGDGVLELQLLDEDAEPLTLKTRPDMLVIIRSDVIARKHTSTSSDYAMCMWVTAPNVTGARGWEAMSTDATDIIPGVKELNDWAEDRLEVLANLEAREELGDIPRAWRRMLRTKFVRNSNLPVAIKGMGTHSPGTHDCEVLWKSLNIGTDFVGNVPISRWDHSEYYDPDPQCYVYSHAFTGGICRTSVNHAQFIDGIELFDNKFFQISQSESGGMEPQQRHILETSYEGLYMAGYTKKALMTAYIAVFTGCTNPEAMYINYTQGAGAGNVSQAITSNRTSFVLGIMGPSTSIDCEQASSHMALMVGASAVAPNHEWRNKTGGHSDASITGGVYLTVTPYMWPRFNAYMNPIGRCFTWDHNANGYVRGEACTSLCQKQYMDKVDGDWIVNDKDCLSTMVGWRMTCNGKAASMTAPHAPAQQEAIYHSVIEAGIETVDLNGIECHGNGGLLDDSVEASAMSKLLRHGEDAAESLILGAVKTATGAQCEATGMTSFLKVMLNIAYASNVPTLHLKQINPHMEVERDTQNIIFQNEHLAYGEQYVFHGCASRGFNGTNTHIVQWYLPHADKVETERLISKEDPIAFWPSGGGILDRDARADDGFFIVGSWTQWEAPQEMQKDGDSSYVYTMTMGVNGFETFQIWMAGDDQRVLHPKVLNSPSGQAVLGPAESTEVMGRAWTIDGRVAQVPTLASLVGDADKPALTDGKDSQLARRDYVEMASRDKGRPGDQYEVRLNIAGKFRAVTWQKVASAEESAPLDPALLGSYYVAGSWSAWQLEEMTPKHEEASGLYVLEVSMPLWAKRSDFMIVRNKDWYQTFHPTFGTVASESWNEPDAEGPDEGQQGRTWCIKCEGGERFRIEFQRSLENGADKRKISWRKAV
mmetsp:Transcript_62523/g.141029  ORF Transcript_62523/g.141029 Transcript_62523/m.141029 type:complete len:1042 (-) Transcript_62523:216-3341(-)